MYLVNCVKIFIMAFGIEKIVNSDRHHNPAIFWVLIIVLLAGFAAAIVTLGGSGRPISQSLTPAPLASREPRFYTVTYKSGVFSPTNLRIHSGDTVRFKNDGFFSIRIMTDNNQLPGFDSIGDIPQGSYFSFTFAEKGIFGYHNVKNQDEQATIIVR